MSGQDGPATLKIDIFEHLHTNNWPPVLTLTNEGAKLHASQ